MTLADLKPGDVAKMNAWVGSMFLLTGDGKRLYANGEIGQSKLPPETPVIYLGRGRYVPPQPGRIELESDGEP